MKEHLILFSERRSSQHTSLHFCNSIAMMHLSNIIPRILLVLVTLCAAIASAAHPFRLVLNQGGKNRSTDLALYCQKATITLTRNNLPPFCRSRQFRRRMFPR
jgi:hypothetical protein